MQSDHGDTLPVIDDALVVAALDKRRKRRESVMAEESVKSTVSTEQARFAELVAIASRDAQTLAELSTAGATA